MITVIVIVVMLIGSGKQPVGAPVAAQDLEEPSLSNNPIIVQDVTVVRRLPAASSDSITAPVATIMQEGFEGTE